MNPTQPYKKLIVPALLNPESIKGLNQQLDEIIKNKTRFAVIKGSEKVFCNGLDLKWVTNNPGGDYANEMAAYATFLKRLQTENIISIAVITGNVSGGGMGIVCACDHVIATPSTSYSLPEGLLGFIPGIIMPALLNRLSPARIKSMVLTGKAYPSATALEWGIIDKIEEEANLEVSLTTSLTEMKSSKIGAVGEIKKMLYNSHLDKDNLGKLGLDNLLSKLNDPEIFERLKDLVEFMDEE